MIETQTQISSQNSNKEKSVYLKLIKKNDISVKKENKTTNKKEQLKQIYGIYAETIWLTGC